MVSNCMQNTHLYMHQFSIQFGQDQLIFLFLSFLSSFCSINLAAKMEVLTKELKVRDEQNAALEHKVKQSEAAMEAYRTELKNQQVQHQQLLQNKLNVAMSEIQNLAAVTANPAVDHVDNSETSVNSRMSLM